MASRRSDDEPLARGGLAHHLAQPAELGLRLRGGLADRGVGLDEAREELCLEAGRPEQPLHPRGCGVGLRVEEHQLLLDTERQVPPEATSL